MNDLNGPKLRDWPFEVLWQEDDSWGESWASRQFVNVDDATEFFESLGSRNSHRVWIGEIGRYKDHGITREAYFYYDAKNLHKDYSHLKDELGERERGLMWFNDEESNDDEGNFALVKYEPISKT